jgi:hypothetical protein
MYNTSLPEIVYQNDVEYRAALRSVFSMKVSSEDDLEIDEISRDELEFDPESTSAAMDFVMERTHVEPNFQILYDLAAAKMFSLDRSIGLAVLFSYDNFADFHRYLCVFLNTGSTQHPSFERIHQKIM